MQGNENDDFLLTLRFSFEISNDYFNEYSRIITLYTNMEVINRSIESMLIASR